MQFTCKVNMKEYFYRYIISESVFVILIRQNAWTDFDYLFCVLITHLYICYLYLDFVGGAVIDNFFLFVPSLCFNLFFT